MQKVMMTDVAKEQQLYIGKHFLVARRKGGKVVAKLLSIDGDRWHVEFESGAEAGESKWGKYGKEFVANIYDDDELVLAMMEVAG